MASNAQPLQSQSTDHHWSSGGQLTTEDLPNLLNILTPVAHNCIIFGSQINVENYILSGIEKYSITWNERLYKVLEYRLTQLPHLTWHGIVQALRSPSVSQHDLASQIESQYIPVSQSLPSVPQQDSDESSHTATSVPHSAHEPLSQHSLSTKTFDPIAQTQTPVALPHPSANNPVTSEYLQLSCPTYPPQPSKLRVVCARLWRATCGRCVICPCPQPPTHNRIHCSRYPSQQCGSPQINHSTSIVEPPSNVVSHVSRGTPSGYHSYVPQVLPYLAHPNTPETYPHIPALQEPLARFTDYIKTIYNSSEVERDTNVVKWPPTPSKIFINLACIDRRSVGYSEYEEITKAMVQDGNVDVISARKGPIDFSEIGKGIPGKATSTDIERRVILVEGAPGVGKSTFAWEFCRRWERGEIAQDYQLVLLLRLRDERLSRAKSLSELVYHPLERISKAVCEKLLFSHEFQVMIILEGYDELPDSCRHNDSIFLQLIAGRVLPLATVLVTSRPWATRNIHRNYGNHIYQHIEILGFSSHQITEYLESTLPQDKARDLSLYLEKRPQIRGCMYIPLNSAIVVTVYQESQVGKCALPTTLSELYTALAQTLLLRYLHGHPEYESSTNPMKSFKNLPPAVHTKFSELCQLAYSGIAGTNDHVQLIFTGLPSDLDNLGFMDSVTELYVTQGTVMSHNFLHLTFQEFLAAVHISTMSPAEQLEHFQRHEQGRLREVLRFLAGLTKLKNVTHEQLRGLMELPLVDQSNEQQTRHCKPMRPDLYVSAHHANWLFEVQNADLIQSLLHNHKASFTFTNKILPFEYYSVVYCIAHSHCWSLTFEEGTEDKIHILANGAGNTEDNMLVSGVETRDNLQCSVGLKSKLSCFSCVEELYLTLVAPVSLPHLPALRILELRMGCKPGVGDFSVDVLESLTIIGTSENSIDIRFCEVVGKHLSSSITISEFCIHGKFISGKGLEEVTKGMSDNIALPLNSLKITLTLTGVTTAVTKSLAQFLLRSATLQYLKICVFEL